MPGKVGYQESDKTSVKTRFYGNYLKDGPGAIYVDYTFTCNPSGEAHLGFVSNRCN
jgi:hypothetical protein